jgi:hypothetical protein
MLGLGAGASPLLWIMMGELLPPDYKVLLSAGAVLSAVYRCCLGLSQLLTTLRSSLVGSTFLCVLLVSVTVTKSFPSLVNSAIGAYGAYW